MTDKCKFLHSFFETLLLTLPPQTVEKIRDLFDNFSAALSYEPIKNVVEMDSFQVYEHFILKNNYSCSEIV